MSKACGGIESECVGGVERLSNMEGVCDVVDIKLSPLARAKRDEDTEELCSRDDSDSTENPFLPPTIFSENSALLQSSGLTSLPPSCPAPLTVFEAEIVSNTSSSGGGDSSLKGVDSREESGLSALIGGADDDADWASRWIGDTALSSSSSSSRWIISRGASFSSARAICGFKCCKVG